MFGEISRQLTAVQQEAPWNVMILGNSLWDVSVAFVVFLLGIIILGFFQHVIIVRLKKLASKTATDVDDTLIRIVQSVRPPFYSFVSLYIASQFLNLSPIVDRGLTILLFVWIVIQGVHMGSILIEYSFTKFLNAREDASAQNAVHLLSNLSRGALWGIGILLVLSNLGVDVTALVAGLGIGGLAIAFAAQNIIADLFSSFVIIFDKPFSIGDFVVVGEFKGTVKKIGVKTTRIKALQGEEVVISNQELTNTRIQNFGKMKERRVVFSIGVLYDTEIDKLERIPNLIQGIIDRAEGARFDRCHFKSFDSSALAYETVYYVLAPDYSVYMDIQQGVNFDVIRAFKSEGVEIAFPTQTIHLKQ